MTPLTLRRSSLLPVLALAAAGVAQTAATGRSLADDNDGHGASRWGQFRGPNGSGVAIGCRPPVDLANARLAWKIRVPPGLSSPVLGAGKLYLTGIENERLVTFAIDAATGTELWRREAPQVALEKVHRSSSPAASTPLVDADGVYVYFGSWGLLAYLHDGSPKWSREIPTPQSLYGTSTSPVAHGDHLILVLDDDANLPDSQLSRSRIVAFRRADGEPAWETARPFVRSGWSTPAIWTHREGQDLVVLGSGRATGYDPATGREKWFATGFSRETIAVPVCGRDHVFVASAMLGGVADEQPDPQPFWEAVMLFDSNKDERLERSEMTEHFTFPLRPELPPGHPGFGIPIPAEGPRREERLDGMFGWIDKDKDGFWTREEFVGGMSFDRGKPRLTAIRPGGTGDVTESHVAWEVNRGLPEIPSPLLLDARIYMVRDGGMLTAVDTENGEILYRERLGAGGQYSASPVAADNHLYLASHRGTVSVAKAGDTFTLLHQHDLGEPVFVTPAIDASTLYLRSDRHLWAFRNPD